MTISAMHSLAALSEGGRVSVCSPVDLPPHAEDVRIVVRHACVDKVDHFMFIFEVEVRPRVLPPAKSDVKCVVKAIATIRAVRRRRSDDVVTVIKVDPRKTRIDFPRTPTTRRPSR